MEPPVMPRLLPLPVFLSLLRYALAGCKFPDYVQSRTGGEQWIGMYSYSEHLMAKFEGSKMRASHCRKLTECRSFDRTCLEDYGNDRYLVSVSDPPNTFMCMEFLQRSRSVFQLNTSREFNRPSKSLCKDMKLDSIPLISNKYYNEATVTCPLVGGYDVQIYDSEMTQLCPNAVIPIRLESECETNEGMIFKFRKKECMHQHLNEAMRPEQKVFCIAKWNSGPYNFVVLRDDKSFRTWCLRYSAYGNDPNRMSAYLFMDFVCDNTELITDSTKYLRLELNRRVLTALCVDEFHGCEAGKSFMCDSDYRPHCPKSCGMCHPYGKVHSCEFHQNYQGTWMQSTRRGTKKITVTAQEFSIEREGRYKCVRFEDDLRSSSLSLLRIFDNGCYPRFVCAEFDRPAPSVLHYRLGNSVVWPIFHHDNPYGLICSDKSFHASLVNHHSQPYEIPQKSQTSVVSLDDEQAVFCNLSLEFGAKMPFVDQLNCSGCLSQESAGTPDRLAVHYNNCSGKPDYTEYLCVASFKSINTYDRVLTRTVDTKDEYLCWVFISSEKFLLLPGSECSHIDAVLALKGDLLPRDILTIGSPNVSLCDTIEPEPDVHTHVLPNTRPASGGRRTASTFNIYLRNYTTDVCFLFCHIFIFFAFHFLSR